MTTTRTTIETCLNMSHAVASILPAPEVHVKCGYIFLSVEVPNGHLSQY